MSLGRIAVVVISPGRRGSRKDANTPFDQWGDLGIVTSAVPNGPAGFVDDYVEAMLGVPSDGSSADTVNPGPPSGIELLRVNPEELARLSGLFDSASDSIEELAERLGSGDSVVRFPGCLIAQVSTAVAGALNAAAVATADRIAYMSSVARGSAGDYHVADGTFAAQLAAVGELR